MITNRKTQTTRFKQIIVPTRQNSNEQQEVEHKRAWNTTRMSRDQYLSLVKYRTCVCVCVCVCVCGQTTGRTATV